MTAGITHILLTHGHGDHVGDTVGIAKETGAVVLANADLGSWLGTKGLERLEMGNTGGTVTLGSFTATFTNALHSSAQITEDGVSHALGNPNGLMLHFQDEASLRTWATLISSTGVDQRTASARHGTSRSAIASPWAGGCAPACQRYSI